MRSYASLGIVAAAALGMAAPVSIVSPDIDPDILRFISPKRRVSACAHSRFKRAKASLKPARKPNRLHVSKRVRRAHRRASK